MKLIVSVFLIVLFLFSGYSSEAQDTLPAFTAKNINGKIILSWVNHFPVVKQLSIQRSSDSLKGFKTILTLPDPSSVTNGFLDNNAPDTVSFYKLYILLDSGKYVFSKSQKPHKAIPPPVVKKREYNRSDISIKPPVNNTADTKSPNTSIQNTSTASSTTKNIELPAKQYEPELTKVINKNRSDGLKADSVTLVRPETFTPSGFVYTNSYGNITVVVPIEKQGKYTIKFYNDNGEEIFQVSNIHEHIFSIDKSNFMRSGWYKFELYENNILREKNKVLVPKDSTIH